MKKLIAAISMLAAAAAFAGAKNTMISFSTPGPDKYADGTTVLDGECYALIWTPAGAAFGGIQANGTAVAPSKLACAVGIAKDGKCPSVVFQIDADYAEANYANGTWGVYLLDTRMVKNGVVTVGCVGGKPQTVNGSAYVTAAGNGGLASAGAATAAVAGSDAVIPDEAKNLEIKSIKIEGANVIVKAVGTVPYLQYGISAGATPDALSATEDAPVTGAADVAEEITIVTPATGDAKFFQVIRK